jgi:Domain of unknown function (DUF4397)
MGFRRIAALMVVSSLSLLAACGGGGGSGDAKVRLVNASGSYSSLDLEIEDETVATGVAYGSASDYAKVDADSITAEVQSDSVTIASLYPTLSKDTHYSLISYGWSGNMKNTLLQEEEDEPDANYSKLLILNLASDAGTLDVFLTQTTDSLNDATPTYSSIAGGASSVYKEISSGTYRVRITGTDDTTDLRLDIPSITLSSEEVATLVITPTKGGVLVNSILIRQQSTVTAHNTSNSRVRVVAAMPGNPTVSSILNGSTTLMSASVAPQIGTYKAVTAGSSSIAVNVNGSALTTLTPTLEAGNDYTVLVWGELASPQTNLLSDDNRLPTVTSKAKFRLVNGVAGLTGGMTMALDYTDIATDITAGNSSTPYNVTYSSDSLLTVKTPTVTTPIFSVDDLTVEASGIYTVFMMGNASSISGQLKRER